MGNVGGYPIARPAPEATVMCAYTAPTSGRAAEAYGGVTVTVTEEGVIKTVGAELLRRSRFLDRPLGAVGTAEAAERGPSPPYLVVCT